MLPRKILNAGPSASPVAPVPAKVDTAPVPTATARIRVLALPATSSRPSRYTAMPTGPKEAGTAADPVSKPVPAHPAERGGRYRASHHQPGSTLIALGDGVPPTGQHGHPLRVVKRGGCTFPIGHSCGPDPALPVFP